MNEADSSLQGTVSLLTDEVRACVGTTVSYTAPEELGRASIRAYAMTIGAPADRSPDEAPPTLIFDTCQLTGNTQPDHLGYLGHGWTLPLPVPCTMIRGGNDYRIARPARADDVIVTTWELTEASEVHDRNGMPMLIVTAVGTLSTTDGDLLGTNTETLLYRPTS